MKNNLLKIQNIQKKWYCIDAKNKILGRLSTIISSLLRGKNKVEYTPNADYGDYIVVINAAKVIVSGKKTINKFYYRHTGYVGGIKKVSFKDMLSKYPEKILYLSVKGMLPKGSLGRVMLRKLKIYANDIHYHTAQNPQLLTI